ncbi:hypothetical protein DSM106972_030610 [Dulcicalothrix desertica PCC 7102]|uniref:Type I restriction modification DNA specificity domain-containing protein n=1 Tax=Dulcicalothrix desertica PCC 7102 TaxID=232991 RepID=A0A3S5K3E1_9CYAN|nr:restriction endonuclease subunit S [Dulcicalothrix desertica]RUT06804.1 hypothetical protein DSM106972_030610 [Dulcicalothrix desertica PCC 7102]
MPQSVDVGVPFLSAKDLKDDGTLDFSNPKYISEEDFERLSRKIKPRFGDIIYSRIGAKLGKARLVEVEKKFLISYSCCLIRPIHECINSKYLQLFLDSRLALNQAHIGTQSIGVPDLGLGVIKQYKVPIPPIAEQHRIVAKVDQLMKLCDELEARQQKKREARVTINNTAIAQLKSAREPEEFNKSWQRIYNNFDLLYSTPENIGKLRQAILQLAVMGKLAPQDPRDEPLEKTINELEEERLSLELSEKDKKNIIQKFSDVRK